MSGTDIRRSHRDQLAQKISEQPFDRRPAAPDRSPPQTPLPFAYENGWYDACAVMIRRMIETLIIECFEKHKISERIKNGAGDFFYLRDLIDKTLEEKSWNLGRNTKQALRKLKDIGDKSAHSRRFIAQRGDIQPLLPEIRAAVQELLLLSELKK